MQLGVVVGTVVATKKNRQFDSAKLLLVEPRRLDDQPAGPVVLAVDSVGAGVGEKVLVVLEGRSAGQAIGRPGAPMEAAIVGIVDEVALTEAGE